MEISKMMILNILSYNNKMCIFIWEQITRKVILMGGLIRQQSQRYFLNHHSNQIICFVCKYKLDVRKLNCHVLFKHRCVKKL